MHFKILFLGLLLGLCGNIVTAQPTAGLVTYYPFNGNANDASGNGNHGVINGGVDLWGQPMK